MHLGVSHASHSGVPGLPNKFWGSPVFIHAYTLFNTDDQIRHGNCTNASRGLSATGECLVNVMSC